MRYSLPAATLFALLAFITAAQAAAPAPGKVGIYATAPCGEAATYLILNQRYAILYDSQDKDASITLGPIEWQEDHLTIAHEDIAAEFHPKLSAAAYATTCPALPGEAYVAFGEALAFFQQVDHLRATCENRPGGACAAEIFSALDVSADQRLSPAEISRGLRALAFFVTYEIIVSRRAKDPATALQGDLAVSTGDLFGASTLTAIASPIVTSSLLQSCDYDGDGFLSLKEILQDRGPLESITLEAGAEMESAEALLQNAITMAPVVTGIITQSILGAGPR
ncbi:hypothetical protein [Pelagibius sp. 7325]|uniref:hypothetical protein n=1 Tax=Pelagibius sp. 7325 TaxID=3131994 RepID=UPI0030ECBED1